MDVKRSGILTQCPSTSPSVCGEDSILSSRRTELTCPFVELVRMFAVIQNLDEWTVVTRGADGSARVKRSGIERGNPEDISSVFTRVHVSTFIPSSIVITDWGVCYIGQQMVAYVSYSHTGRIMSTHLVAAPADPRRSGGPNFSALLHR